MLRLPQFIAIRYFPVNTSQTNAALVFEPIFYPLNAERIASIEL